MFDVKSLFAAYWHDELPASAAAQEAQWLQAEGSLTEQIKAVCLEPFRVVVLAQHWRPACPAGAALLGLSASERVLHRLVALCDGKTPLVFACSLLPEAALAGRFAGLGELGDQPLGHWIFMDPVLKRAEMSFAELPVSAFPRGLGLDPRAAQPIHGRRTIFTGAEKPILVSEFFLPALRTRRFSG